MEQFELDLGVSYVKQPILPSKDEPNPMCRKVGYGPEGAICKTCVHLERKIFHSQAKFYKCMYQVKRVNGHLEGKDYRLKWKACKLYEEKGVDEK